MVSSYRPAAELEVINPWVLYQVDPLSEVKGFITSKLVAQMVKNLPAMQETWIQSLGQKDPLEKGMATHSRILAWRSPMGRVHGIAKNRTRLSNFHYHYQKHLHPQNTIVSRLRPTDFMSLVWKLT